MTDAATEPAEVKRDRWGRPLIVPPDGGDPIAYTRVSTLAKCLDDQSALTAWKQRKVLEGAVRRPDLLTLTTGILANGDPDADYQTKRELNRVCSQLTEAAGASRGSSAGTGFHSLTEAVDRGQELLFISDADAARIDAYREATAGYTPLEAETFVVNDAVRAAGTFDRLWRCPDGRVRVGDLKTGKSEADYPLSTTVQIAVYAHGLRYDPATDERAPIHPELDVNTGLLVHMPPTGGCRVIPLDLNRGWRAAQAAHFVHHEVRQWKPEHLIRGTA